MLSVSDYSQEELNEMSFIEMAYIILGEKRQAIPFKGLITEINNLLKLSDAEVKSRVAQFYTDLNIDGRFLCIGDNSWGLRPWYPYEQIEVETTPTVRPKKKKKAKKAVDEDDTDDFEEDLEDEELDYDEVDLFEEDDEAEDEVEEIDEEVEDELKDEIDEEDDFDDDSEDFDDEDEEEDGFKAAATKK